MWDQLPTVALCRELPSGGADGRGDHHVAEATAARRRREPRAAILSGRLRTHDRKRGKHKPGVTWADAWDVAIALAPAVYQPASPFVANR